MTQEQYKNFSKRYDKFKKNNLPTPFWDDERITFEYVFYTNEKENNLKVNNYLIDALCYICNTGFYYSFTNKHIVSYVEDGKTLFKSVVGHNHAHSFEEVVRSLYYSPRSFKISKEEEQFYSKQELDYLNKVQKYLLFIGLDDIETNKVSISRYRNKKYRKYQNAFIYKFSNSLIKEIIDGKIDYYISECNCDNYESKDYKPSEYQALIVNEEGDFKLFIEFNKIEVKEFKEIKDKYIDSNYKDDDKVFVRYFKLLERF